MKKRLFTYAVIFFSGLFLALSVVYYAEWRYEENILNVITKRVNTSCKGEGLANRVDTAMMLVHQVVDPMRDIYSQGEFEPIKSLFVSPSFFIYYFGKDACGGYSSFTARLLGKMDINTRFVQQNVNGVPGGHITLVVEDGPHLYLIDPMFKWTFRDTTGHLSDIHEVAANWPYYFRHRPPRYRRTYNYQNGWIYTNWDKYGRFSRLMYSAGVKVFGEQKMNSISLRTHFLNITEDCFFLLCLLLACLLIFLIRKYLKYIQITKKTSPVISPVDHYLTDDFTAV